MACGNFSVLTMCLVTRSRQSACCVQCQAIMGCMLSGLRCTRLVLHACVAGMQSETSRLVIHGVNLKVQQGEVSSRPMRQQRRCLHCQPVPSAFKLQSERCARPCVLQGLQDSSTFQLHRRAAGQLAESPT